MYFSAFHCILFCFIVATALHYEWFGQAEGPIHFDGLRCTGEEDSLLDCHHKGVGNHSCSHYEDASVLCYIGELKSIEEMCVMYVI